MKMAKASEADLQMAMDMSNALDLLGQRWLPVMPEACEVLQDPDDEVERFDSHNDVQCGRALRHLLHLMERGSLMRVVWGAAVMLDPRNKCCDPNADTIEHHPDAAAGLEAKQARPLDDWSEDIGCVLWWRFPVNEPPYCGHPNCDNWPGYHTHWTPLVLPDAPKVGAEYFPARSEK